MSENQWEKGTTYNPPEEGGKSLEQYEDILGFDARELQGKSILDLGTGETEKLSKELKQKNIETNVISLNPDYSHDEWLRKNIKKKDWQGKSVAGIAQQLPFKDESFDVILGLESTTRYVSPKDSIEEAKTWGREVVRTLKKGGEARLWPVLELDDNKKEDRERLDIFIQYLQSLGVEVILEKWEDKNVPEISGYRLVIKKL